MKSRIFTMCLVSFSIMVQAQTYTPSTKPVKNNPGGIENRPFEPKPKPDTKPTTIGPKDPKKEIEPSDINQKEEPVLQPKIPSTQTKPGFSTSPSTKVSGNTNAKELTVLDETEKRLPSDKFCARLWEHLNNWKGEVGESAGAYVELKWFEDNGSIFKDKPLNDSGLKEIPGPDVKGELTEQAVKPNDEHIYIPIEEPLADEVTGPGLDINTAKQAATDGSITFFNKRGGVVTGVNFDDPDKFGNIWGKCTIKGKKFVVLYIWKRGKFSARNKFILLE